MGCVLRFNSPYHPQSTRLAKRAMGNVKNIVSKLAMDHPKQWHTYLPMVMWCLRDVPDKTTGVAPWTLAREHLPSGGPLALLKDSWCNMELPISFGRDAREYLRGLHTQLEDAKAYAQVNSVLHDSLCCVDTCAVICDKGVN